MSSYFYASEVDTHPHYSVVASSKDVYQLRFYNIQAGDDEEED